MSRIDKAQPKVGNYRANLAAALPAQFVEHLVAVGHDAQGRIVWGNGVSGIKGVVCFTKIQKVGARIDVFTAGEVVEFGPNDHTATADAGTADAGVDFGTPGTNYYGHNNGTVTATKGVDGVYIGHTERGSRLVLRVNGAV